MTSLSQFIPLIIAALLAMAALIPGLNAVENSILELRASKKINAIEFCKVVVDKKGKGKFAKEEIDEAQANCTTQQNEEINNNFKPALYYVCKMKQIVNFSEVSGATSSSIETGINSSASVATCKDFAPTP